MSCLAAVREGHPKAVHAATVGLLPCLRLCGIMPSNLEPTSRHLEAEGAASRTVTRELADQKVVDLTVDDPDVMDLTQDSGPTRPTWDKAVAHPGYNERSRGGRMVVFTDGAARANQHARSGGLAMVPTGAQGIPSM